MRRDNGTKNWMVIGDDCLSKNNFSQAEECFKKVSPTHQHYYVALGNLGWLAMQGNRPEEAVKVLQQALALRPDYVDALNTLGAALQTLGRLAEAERVYGRVLAMQPDYVEAIFNLATTVQELGRWQEAESFYRQTLQLRTNHMGALSNLGIVLNHLQRLPEAEECYRQVLVLKPNHVQALNNLALTLKNSGRLEEAEKYFRRALKYAPNHLESLSNLGYILNETHQLQQAESCFRQALALAPDYVEIINNLGISLYKMSRLVEAEECYHRALALKPDYVEAINNLGTVLHELGRLVEAEECFRRVLQLEPDHGNALVMSYYCAQYQCKWHHLAKDCQALCDAVAKGVVLQPFPLLSLPNQVIARPALVKEQMECAIQYSRKQNPAVADLSSAWRFDRQPERLKIGYLSHDFQNHPVACMAVGVFGCHDRSRFEIIAYSYGRDDGQQTRQQVVGAVDSFVDLRPMADSAAARRIVQDGVHILVEMTGHTKGSRLPIASFRPAPIQATMLGYAGTLGTTFIDYFLLSRYVVPPGIENYYTEKLVFLPDGLIPNDWRRQTITLRTPERQEYGLPEKGLIFANFNANYKISPDIFDIWMMVLRQHPDSVLWLWHSNPWSVANLRREAAARGVAGARLHFAPYLPYGEHLSLFRLVDLFLDTHPYNASSTANDALWAGCPVLTCRGETCISRSAGNQLTGVGLADLVTDSLADYATLALALASQPQRLMEIRQRLANNLANAPLFDTAGYAKSIEAAYEAMWARFQAGLPPDTITV